MIHTYNIHGINLQNYDSVKLLCVNIDSNFNWKEHCTSDRIGYRSSLRNDFSCQNDFVTRKLLLDFEQLIYLFDYLESVLYVASRRSLCGVTNHNSQAAGTRIQQGDWQCQLYILFKNTFHEILKNKQNITPNRHYR